MANTAKLLAGTAWLSSARVVECSIHLLNERNPYCKSQTISLLKKHTFEMLNENLFYLLLWQS
jgi:hypothetical protein